MLSLLLHELRLRRGGMMGWGIGLSIYAGMYTAFYPALPAEMLALDYENIELFQAFGDMNMTNFDGYMGSSVFNFLGVLIGIFAVISGVAALAGEEDNGTLEGIVTLPLARWKLVAAKAGALATAHLLVLLIAGLVVTAVYTGIRSQVDSAVTPANLLVMTLQIWPLALVLAMVSLFLGALLPSRRTASAAAATVLIAAYFGNNLAGMFAGMRAVQQLSPFHYFETGPLALTSGLQWTNMAILMAAAFVLLLLAMASFDRRDISVGRWAWSGGRRGGAG